MEAAIEDEPAIVDESTLHFGRQLNSKKVFESNPLTFLYVWSRCIYAISGGCFVAVTGVTPDGVFQ